VCETVQLQFVFYRNLTELSETKEAPMTTSAATLDQLASRLRQQAVEMATLRAAVDVQFKRIAAMQAGLDVLRFARTRRHALRGFWSKPASRDGNQRSHA
jgi:hypothetical protein